VAPRIQIAIDCKDPERLAAFWAAVLDYRIADPPPGYDSWAEHSRAQAEEPGEAWIKISDPDGLGPTLLFHRVPEAKITKNRVHLDIRAPGDVQTFIDRVIELGGSKVRDVIDDGGYFAVMHDPEGNEFCTGGGQDTPD
jgi:predicted enzyme related to lactoylglutathione lyase